MQKNILDLTKKFISIESTFQNPEALKEILDLALESLNGYKIEKFQKNGVQSALIYSSKFKTRPKKFKILLNGHLDVIPGKEYQFKPIVKGNRLYGVGSMDMKGNVACLICVFKEMVDKVNYPLALQLVTDEEIGGFDGTKHQIKKGVRADFIIAGEPTNFDIVYKAKGILQLKISASGKTSHSAYPWRGKNAVWKMNDFLNIIKNEYSIPKKQEWCTTVNLSIIETQNKAYNKIPDDCTIGLDIRYIPEDEKTILKNIKKILPKGFTLEVIEQESALHIDNKNMYVTGLQKVSEQVLKKNILLRGANGSSDARHFVKIGSPGIEFGPVGGDIGGDNEWVDIPSLEKYYEILKNYLQMPIFQK